MNTSKKDLDYMDTQEQETRAINRQQKSSFSKFSKVIIGIGVICLIISGLFFYQSSKDEPLESASAVESIRKLSTLASVQAHIKTVVSNEDNELLGKNISVDLPGSKRELLLVVGGDVTAGIDLSNLSKDNVSIDENKKTVHITLPHATFIQEPSLDFENIETYSIEGLFRSEANWDEGFELADTAQQNIEKEAIEFGLLKTAEDNAGIALNEFFETLGYTATVSFE